MLLYVRRIYEEQFSTEHFNALVRIKLCNFERLWVTVYVKTLKLGKEQKQITYLLTFLLVRRGESLLCAFAHQCEK
jgi:hypothetical protein